jgi:hypothetical protein
LATTTEEAMSWPAAPTPPWGNNQIGDPIPHDTTVLFDSEPILGWRAWRIEFHDGDPHMLTSVTYGIAWPKRKPMRAHCLYAYAKNARAAYKPHRCPTLKHACGIYATSNREQAKRWATPRPLMLPVIGTARFWGHILKYTQGLKAEYAYPATVEIPLVLPDTLAGLVDLEQLADWLEDAYGVDVSPHGKEAAA